MSEHPSTTGVRDVIVVREDGPHVWRLLSIDHIGGKALVMPPNRDGWQAVDSWTVVDPPYDMLTDRAELLDQAVELARDDARRMSVLDTAVLDAYRIAGGDGLTNDALARRLEQVGMSQFDLMITPKVVAEHLAAGRIEVLAGPERSRRQRHEPPHVRRITGLGRLIAIERHLATAVPS